MFLPPKKKFREKGETSAKNQINNGVYTDRLSSLPDSLIHHIFSFMDTTAVVQSGILSNRWKALWMSAPTLNFDLEYWRSKHPQYYQSDLSERFHKFINIIHNVLNCRDESKLRKFSLSASFNNRFCYHLPRINSWLVRVLECGVEHLALRFPLGCSEDTLEFPNDLFTSTVRVLEILMDEPTIFSVSLPNIPVGSGINDLQLSGVKLPDGDVSGELVLNCGVLKNLVINHCDVHHLKVLTIASPLLEKLWVCLCVKMDDACKTVVKIYAAKLVSLTLSLEMRLIPYAVRYSIEEDLLSLVDANVVMVTDEADFLENFSMKILPRIYTARKLTLSYSSTQVLAELRELQKKIPYGFHNLRYIMLLDGTWFPRHRALLNFLESCPLLETIVWRRTWMGVRSSSLTNDAEELVPNQGAYTCLRTAEFQNIRGTDFELKFIASILEIAIHLKKVIVEYDCNLPDTKRRELERKVLSLPLASSSVTLTLLNPST
ncbi:hypothetical protein ACHQM5_028234 [Ranunculus cassubicifolius]